MFDRTSLRLVQVFYGNLSAALHRLEDFEGALTAAEKAIELDSKWMKVQTDCTANSKLCVISLLSLSLSLTLSSLTLL